MAAPGGGEPINCRLGGVAVLRHQRYGKILADKTGGQTGECNSHEQELQQGGGPAQPHQRPIPPGGTPKWGQRLHYRQHECQDQRQLSDFGSHCLQLPFISLAQP